MLQFEPSQDQFERFPDWDVLFLGVPYTRSKLVDGVWYRRMLDGQYRRFPFQRRVHKIQDEPEKYLLKDLIRSVRPIRQKVSNLPHIAIPVPLPPHPALPIHQFSVAPVLDQAGPCEAPEPVASSSGILCAAAAEVLAATLNEIASTRRSSNRMPEIWLL